MDVPKRIADNLEFRRRAMRAAATDKELCRSLWIACKRDPVFFTDVFCWTYRPKAKAKVQPWICYGYQESTLRRLNQLFQGRELDEYTVVWRKSRDMGASWANVYSFLHQFLFYEGESFLMVSRNADYVDKKGNPKALFWKLDFALKYLPQWLKPPIDRLQNHLENLSNGSVIDGESTTGEVARGDRRTGILLDEFAAFELNEGVNALASTKSAAKVRIINSTPKGAGNAYHQVWHTKPSAHLKMERFIWMWWDHPMKREGLYKCDPQGLVEYLDPATDYSKLEKYEWVKDGKLRSPWYDATVADMPETLRRQEIDAEFVGSGNPVFSSDELARIIAKHAQFPLRTGELVFEADGKPKKFDDRAGGSLKLWCEIGADNRPPSNTRYVMGIDLSWGTGNSNTAAVILDRRTGEMVAEYANTDIKVDRAATYFAALGRWFCGVDISECLAIWDAGGPGRNFKPEFCERLGYNNIWHRRDTQTASLKIGDKAGFEIQGNSKNELLQQYFMALAAERVVVRSRESLDECAFFEFNTSGDIVHIGAVTAMDSSGAKKNHGDRATAAALANRGMEDVPQVAVKQEEKHVYSLAWRRDRWKRDRNEETEDVLVGI